MPVDYVIDTHALVWFLEGNPRLGAAAKLAMSDPGSVLHLPVIALAEACWVIEKKRCAIPSVADLLRDVDADPRVVLKGVRQRVCRRELKLQIRIRPIWCNKVVLSGAIHANY